MSTTDPNLKYQDSDVPDASDLSDDVIVSPDTRREQRLPPHQSRTRKWPVLQYAQIPVVENEDWQLSFHGSVENPLTVCWAEYRKLPRVKVFADFHCVEKWSRLGNLWEGVPFAELLKRVQLQPEAMFVSITGYDNDWTTNIPLEELQSDGVLLADRHDGETLAVDHGGPVRLIVPHLYAWKSAKWVKSFEFTAENKPGTWESKGYHDRGSIWEEERFRS